MTRLIVVHDDITTLEVDAVVNAANPGLLGGGGVDGAVHRAAGRKLLEACRRLGGCDHGDAKITPGFDLPARHVIHAVGPIWRGGVENEDHLLELCYRRSLELAAGNELRSIAFPCISTGAYGFPKRRAAEIAVTEVTSFIDVHPLVLERVVFCCFDQAMAALYRQLLPLVAGGK